LNLIPILFPALLTLNEAITATTVIIAASLMFYNLSHGWNNRVVRASSIVLACVIVVYLGDVFLALGRDNPKAHIEAWLRFEWLGIGLIPAALFHLSDALLETTGLTSRGRRIRVMRILYLFGSMFAIVAIATDSIGVGPVPFDPTNPLPTLRPGPLWLLYLIYFAIVLAISFNNVLRARRRCLTRVTHRRMTYLLLTFLMPAIGIFPYALVVAPLQDHQFLTISLIDVGSVGIALMLAFMAYPLAFFGQNRPDRVIKADLLRFFLHGPLTGAVVLAVILFLPGVMAALAFPGSDFLPFVAVAAVLIVQWGIAIVLPYLDRLLIYVGDQDQSLQLQRLSDRLLTAADARQQLEAILAALCDYLRVSSAFVVSFGAEGAKLESEVGSLRPATTWLASPEFQALADAASPPPDGYQVYGDLLAWQSFWLIRLRSPRPASIEAGLDMDVDPISAPRLVGLLGLWARSPQPDLSTDEHATVDALISRTARVLDNMQLQAGVFAALRGLVPTLNAGGQLSGAARYGDVPALVESSKAAALDTPVTPSALADLIHDALRDYWGGPNLTASPLLELQVVRQALTGNDNNPANALRAVLTHAIESLRPEGIPRKTPDWTLYNVLHMRFVQGQKVAEVADSLAMSNANIHRKQRVAIEQVAARLAAMEQDAQHR